MKKLAIGLPLLGAALSSRTASAANLLSYTLSAPLMQPGCAGDHDGDCLNDAVENELAWIASPQYFLDEEESCASAWYLNNGPMDGSYGRADFVQVRPGSTALKITWSGILPVIQSVALDIANWAPNNGLTYFVSIVYVFGHFFDCHSSHLGDNENVVYTFSSTDLKTWSLGSSVYNAHGAANTFGGDYLAARASEIGSLYASVAADQDGHGSWPGKTGDSSDCAGPEDDCNIFTCPFQVRDCFYDDTMRDSYQNGHWEYPDTSRNIGEPFSEWNRNVLWVWGDYAQITLPTVYGNNSEIISSDPPYDVFCGFTCASRGGDGNCSYEVNGTTDCTSSMYSKWLVNPITVNGVRHGS